MMAEIAKACKIDLVALYAEEVDNAALLSLFGATGNTRKILLVKKHNLGLLSNELQEMLDDCFTIPMDSGEFMIRLRRMFRAAEQDKAESLVQPQEIKPAEQTPSQFETYTDISQRTDIQPQPIYLQQAVLEQPQPVRAVQEQVVTKSDAFTAPAKMDNAYPNESVRFEPAQAYSPPIVLPSEKLQAKEAEVAAKNAGGDKGHKKKKKSILRYLSKAELLEIILEQEKMVVALNAEVEEDKKELENHRIIMDESGSIADAALKLNDILKGTEIGRPDSQP